MKTDMKTGMKKRYAVCITGASCTELGIRVLKALAADKGREVHAVATRAAREILKTESGIKLTTAIPKGVHLWEPDDFTAPIASGSFRLEATLVVPCSMKSLAGIASGYAENLALRAADVALKERWRLVLCPRETPLSPIHLENMLKLSRIGVMIVPPMPALYHNPKNIAGVLDFIAGKVLDAAGVEHDLFRRWGGLRSK
jgi:4-hydroxy-3-polyprenylbenzoate decarboxylase